MKELKKISKLQKRISCLYITVACVFCFAYPVYATAQITSGLDVLKEIIITVITGIGALIVLWGIFEFGQSLQSHDPSQQTLAFKRIAGGIAMIAGPQLLNLFI